MSVGIAGDADPGDAVTLQRAAIDDLDRAAELARRVPAIARDHQHATHPRLAAQAGEKAIERLAACEVAHRQMRHRLESAARRRVAASIASSGARVGTALT